MQNKKLSKLLTGCALLMALTMAAAPINVLAAEGGDTPVGGSKTKIDPTAKNNPDTGEINEAYSDTDIDVWAFTKEKIVYSVDVEWGAMTFQYETGKWDAENLEMSEGRGWLIYDQSTDTVLEGTDGSVVAQDAINRVAVTNHSNAAVYAQLSYNGETGYTDTTGSFTASTKASEEDFDAQFSPDSNVMTLLSANNNKGESGTKGKPTVANVYFMPTGIANDKKAADGIAKWTTIGKITVGIVTEKPEGAPEVTPTP